MDNWTVAIVTIDDYINYGNRLQNCALMKLLQNEGFNSFMNQSIDEKNVIVSGVSAKIVRRNRRIEQPVGRTLKTNRHRSRRIR